jgi:CBS domain-containing protein/precorrin-6B methylase 2
MKVKDFAQKNPVVINYDRPVREVARLLFNLGISAVLVKKEGKLVGIVTEEDILQNLFPSLQEVMEDYTRARTFEYIEEGLSDMLNKPVSHFMVTKLKTTTPETPLMKAQSTMLVNHFSHLPVVNENMEIKGIISQGDIFKALVGTDIPYDDEEEYHNWLSFHFDLVAQNLNRYVPEIDSLNSLFKKYNVKTVIDLGCGTGSHALGLAEKNYTVTGLDISTRMRKVAREKREKTSSLIQKHVDFPTLTNYEDYLNNLQKPFDAAVFMGNALTHMPKTYKKVLETLVLKGLNKNTPLVFQMVNFEKVIGVKGGFKSFSISDSRSDMKRKYAFLEIYTTIPDDTSNIMLTMSILEYSGKRWRNKSINSTPVAYITRKDIEALFKKFGFSKITFYGSNFGEKIFDKPFDSINHDWLNVVAVK